MIKLYKMTVYFYVSDMVLSYSVIINTDRVSQISDINVLL